jgi:hypothetical protein
MQTVCFRDGRHKHRHWEPNIKVTLGVAGKLRLPKLRFLSLLAKRRLSVGMPSKINHNFALGLILGLMLGAWVVMIQAQNSMCCELLYLY